MGIVSILTSHHKQLPWLSPLFNILMGTSIWYHAQNADKSIVIYTIDKCLVHFIALLATLKGCSLSYLSLTNFNCFQSLFTNLGIFWLAYIYIIWVYYISKKSHLPGDDWKPWHASVYYVASFGCYMLATASQHSVLCYSL